MDSNKLLEKKEELEFKIEKLNEQLRFGSSGNTSGIEAIAKMKENLKLVNKALLTAPPVAVVVEPVAAPVVPVPAAPIPVPQPPPPAPPAPPVDGPVIVPTTDDVPQLGNE